MGECVSFLGVYGHRYGKDAAEIGFQWPPDAPGRARRLPGVVGHRKDGHAHQRGGDVAGWLPLLSQTQTAIEAVEAAMKESLTPG